MKDFFKMLEPMNILNVNAIIDPVMGGGTAERTLQISLALKGEGANCQILTTDIGLKNGLIPRLSGLSVIAYKCLLNRFYIPRASFKSIKKTVGNVDIIHIMGHWSVLNALVYLAARQMNKPYVVCPAGALPIYGRSKILKVIYNWIVGVRIIKNASAWIAITEDEREHFLHIITRNNALRSAARLSAARERAESGPRTRPRVSPSILRACAHLRSWQGRTPHMLS